MKEQLSYDRAPGQTVIIVGLANDAGHKAQTMDVDESMSWKDVVARAGKLLEDEAKQATAAKPKG